MPHPAKPQNKNMNRLRLLSPLKSLLRLRRKIGSFVLDLSYRLASMCLELPNRAARFLRYRLRSVRPNGAAFYIPNPAISENLLGAYLLNPISWLRWTSAFALNWLLSRPYTSLVLAMPAIVLGPVILAVTSLGTGDQTQNRVSRYRALFDESVKSRDFEVATVVLRSLMDSSPSNLELRYQQALLEQLRGNTSSAIEQMSDLASSSQHGMAAMWMISQGCQLQELKKWSEQEHARFREWIEIGLSNLEGENLLSAKVLMFSYLAEVGAFSDAARLIGEVVPARPELGLAAATLCRSQHDVAGAAKYAGIAERHFAAELSRKPTDLNARVNLARVLMVQSKFEQAAKLLNDGYRLTNDTRLASVTGEALLVWSNHLGAEDFDSKNLVKRLQILHAAIGVAPSDPAVGSAIAQLIIDCRDSSLPEVIRLKEALLSGAAPVSTHFIRGTLALLDNRVAEAKTHLELAYQLEPNVPAILNNLAIALVEIEGSDLEQARSLVDMAIGKQPNHAYFLETRGQIHLKMQRWQEAIADLEAALEAKELRPAIYPSLALAYEKTGATELTQVYRKLALEVRAN